MSIASVPVGLGARLASLANWPSIVILASIAVLGARFWLAKDPREATYRSIITRDPKLGAKVEAARQVIAPLPAIVICASLCNCKKADASILLNRGAGGLPVRVVVPGSPSMLNAFPSLLPYKRLFVFDPELRLIRKLNANFLPRAYLLDRDGALLWKSEEVESSWRDLADQAAHASETTR